MPELLFEEAPRLYFLALATDFDGTIAQHGHVDARTQSALETLRKTGRRLILVTGRDLPDLKAAYPGLAQFDWIVAENGALLYNPLTEEVTLIAPPPPDIFVERLKERGVRPLTVGESIVATWEPNETIVLETIREMGLELQIVFNKGAVMVLPSGINKAEGLKAALRELGLSFHNVVGVGDAQNDIAFLETCGCAAAVDNALPAVKKAVDIVLSHDHGAGVVELIDMICTDDGLILPAERHGLLLGTDENGEEVFLDSGRGSVLISGTSGVGKSKLATALTERMREKLFEFCVFDPEGDYDELEGAVSEGNASEGPDTAEALKLLETVGANVVVNTQALDVSHRPTFFAKLLPQLAALRARTGRPHWLVIDEAHHLLPLERGDAPVFFPDNLPAVVFITVHPKALATTALKSVDMLVALGRTAPDTLTEFCQAVGLDTPAPLPTPDDGEVLFWRPHDGCAPRKIRPRLPKQAHKRHTRKYALGNLGEDISFYFRGPDGNLNLRAQNLLIFTQLADGIDDATWEFHLHAGDYSAWFRDIIKDQELADEAAAVERDTSLLPAESRSRIRDAVTRRYTAPASKID